MPIFDHIQTQIEAYLAELTEKEKERDSAIRHKLGLGAFMHVELAATAQSESSHSSGSVAYRVGQVSLYENPLQF